MLEITTSNGNVYRIHDNSNIQRMDQPDFKPSGQWRMLGLQACNSGYYVELADINTDWLAQNPLKYKNGNPRYTVRDFDYGTHRIWGNGVASIRVVTEDGRTSA